MTTFSSKELSAGSLSLSLLPYGLTFHSLHLSSLEGATRDLLIGHADPADHHLSKAGGRGFRNQTVGRYANRLPSGRTVRDGMVLDLVDNSSGAGVCLHGGAKGLDTQEWSLVTRNDSALFPSSDAAFPPLDSARGEEAIYRFLSPAGTDGFPLTLEIEGLVQVKKPEEEGVAQGVVLVVLRAKIVEDGSEGIEFGTPVNLTVHWGFNLGSFDGVEDESVKEHKLWIDSSRVTALDASMLPTGELDHTTPEDALNFSQGTFSALSSHRTIGSNFPPNGLDHTIVLSSPHSLDTPKVVLTSPDLKTSLSFRTNQSSVQTYTASGFNGDQTRRPEHQSSGSRGYEKFGAVFLEFQHPVATFLNPKLEEVAGTSTILKRGEVYENVVWVEVKQFK